MNKNKAQQLIQTVHKLSRLGNVKEAFGDVTRAEFFVMSLINDTEEMPGITVTKIANILEMTPAATSKLLRIIEQKGYIVRILNDNDRRLVHIRLTEKGKTLVEESRDKVHERIAKVLEKLGETDTADLFRLFERLLDILQEEKDQSAL